MLLWSAIEPNVVTSASVSGRFLRPLPDAGVVAEDDVRRPRAVQAGAVVPVDDVRLHDERAAPRPSDTGSAGIGAVGAVPVDPGRRRAEALRHVEDHRVALGLAVVVGLVAVAATRRRRGLSARSDRSGSWRRRCTCSPCRIRRRCPCRCCRGPTGSGPSTPGSVQTFDRHHVRRVVLAAGDDVAAHDVGAVQRARAPARGSRSS